MLLQGILCPFIAFKMMFWKLNVTIFTDTTKIIECKIRINKPGVCGLMFRCMLYIHMIKDNLVQQNMFTIAFYLMCRCYSDTVNKYYHIHGISSLSEYLAIDVREKGR